jgi:cystathionine gamma-lyase
MGVISTNDEELYEKLKFLQKSIGAVPSPFECYLAIRGLKTLHLRMKACSENALRIAEMLESHSKIERVMYPGLASHPQHEVSRKQMRYFSGMITFWLKGGLEQSRIFLESVKLFTCAESLGAVESLIEHPAIMTHASVPPEQRRQLGISDTMVRISVGCENIDDLMHDMTQALEKVPETSE